MYADSNLNDDPASSSREIIEEATRVGFSSRFLLAEGVGKCPIPIFVIDERHRVTAWNQALAQLTGLDEATMLGSRDHWRAFYPSPRPTLADLVVDGTVETEVERCYHGKYHRSPLLDGGIEVSDFFPGIGGDGRWLFFTAAPLRDPAGRVVGAIETLQDVTSRRRAEAALKESQSFLHQIVDGSSVPTFVIDREHRVTHWNRACEAMTGIAADAIVGSCEQWRAFYPEQRPVMADLILDCALDRDVDRFYHGKFRGSRLIDGAFEAEDFFPQFGDGGRWLFFTAAPLADAAGEFIGAIETLQDITEQKRAEEALRESELNYRLLSITDALTGLFNPRHFRAQIEAEAGRAERYRRPLSVLLLDLDDFKKINDTYGHVEGDRALEAAAAAMRSCLRKNDSAYRYGGEEFAVLLPETPLDAACRFADRLRAAIAQAVVVTPRNVRLGITASIGAAEFAPPESVETLLRRADDGVYAAKRAGKNCVSASVWLPPAPVSPPVATAETAR